jgi:hypothetical protein
MATAVTETRSTVRPKDEAEKTELIREILRGHKAFSVEYLAQLGFAQRPTITGDMDHDERTEANHLAYQATIQAIMAGDYRASGGQRVGSTHDQVDSETAFKILWGLVLHGTTWRMARRMLRVRLDREAAEEREAARLSNRIAELIDQRKADQRRQTLADLRAAIAAMVDGDTDQLPTIVDLAERLDLSSTNVRNLTARIEEQRGV